tara:strand:- start:345 stop:542 length:198 start_codon:yes stop_codon:yes gene_type:complete
MNAAKTARFSKLATKNAQAKAGDGWALFAPALQEMMIKAAAFDLLMAQDMDKYAPAQDLLNCCLS